MAFVVLQTETFFVDYTNCNDAGSWRNADNSVVNIADCSEGEVGVGIGGSAAHYERHSVAGDGQIDRAAVQACRHSFRQAHQVCIVCIIYRLVTCRFIAHYCH